MVGESSTDDAQHLGQTSHLVWHLFGRNLGAEQDVIDTGCSELGHPFSDVVVIADGSDCGEEGLEVLSVSRSEHLPGRGSSPNSIVVGNHEQHERGPELGWARPAHELVDASQALTDPTRRAHIGAPTVMERGAPEGSVAATADPDRDATRPHR